jgi:phenylacetate-CoA ligase
MKQLEAIYACLPEWLQDMAVTAQGAVYYRQRFGAGFREEHALLKATEKASALQLELLQVSRLRRMLAHAAATVPFYRQRISSAAISALRAGDCSAFQSIPVTEKFNLRQDPTAFLAGGRVPRGAIRWNTSGTTGTPIQIVYAPSSVSRQYAYVESYREQAGVSRFDRRAQFTGKMIAPGEHNHRYWRYDWASRALMLSTVHLDESTIPRYLSAIRQWQPRYLTGYPSAIALLAHYALRHRRYSVQIPAILTSAETLLPEQRDVIESAFSGRVYDQYGQTEMQSFWFECRYRRMHAHPLFGVTEILRPNGEPAPPGETGDVVLTGLINPAMPLIRYRIGDRAAWSGEDLCPCGRAMPMIEAIEGRREDYLFSPQRGWVGRMDPSLKGVTGVLECQFIQHRPNELQVLCVAAPDYSPLAQIQLEKNLLERLGDQMRIDFRLVPQIPRGANGKFRAVVCHLDRGLFPQSPSREVPTR